MTAHEARLELATRSARTNLLSYLRYVWWENRSLEVGRHTRIICDRLTRAYKDLKAGKSTYLIIQVPQRHGKTTVASKAFPSWFLGIDRQNQPDVILSGYGGKLVEGCSKRIKAIMHSKPYQYLFPGVLPARGSDSCSEWAVEGSTGSVIAHGIGGGLTGHGGSLIIIDDTVKNIAEARSSTYRQRTWDSFRNDILTRQNPGGCIVLLIGTPWHIDDVQGRTIEAVRSDPDFPPFELLKFPARNPTGGYLFEDLLGGEWYRRQYATLGRMSSALLDCNPVPETGNRFDIASIDYRDNLNGFPMVNLKRTWDLASSDSQRANNDWTVGIKGAVTKVGGAYHLWIHDIQACRHEAGLRNKLIGRTMDEDGPAVRQYIETFGAYKDTLSLLKAEKRGTSIVHRLAPKGDKSQKLAPLEPIFDAGNIHVYRPGCHGFKAEFENQLLTFPSGTHDDFPDTLGLLYHACTINQSGMLI